MIKQQPGFYCLLSSAEEQASVLRDSKGNGCMDKQTEGQDAWTNEWIELWMDGRTNRRIYTDGWMKRLVGG